MFNQSSNYIIKESHQNHLTKHYNANVRQNRNIATDDLIKMVEFVLKNYYFEFNGEVKQQYLHLHTLVFLWMTLKVNLLKLNRYSH